MILSMHATRTYLAKLPGTGYFLDSACVLSLCYARTEVSHATDIVLIDLL